MNKPLPFKMRQETPMEKFRAESFWWKENETLEWIRSFAPHDVFFDVGANVGIYSLYAASLYPEMKTVAFEPMFSNYSALSHNIHLNGFAYIEPRQYAVGNRAIFVELHVSNNEAGQSGSQVRVDGGRFDRKMGVIMVSIDDFCMGKFPKPAHVKIDIDGQELEVVKGMQKTLPHIKSALIEVRPESKKPIMDIMLAAGFTTNNRFNAMSPHSRERRAKEGIPDENIVFTR